LCFAGLASWWKNPQTGEALRSCAIVTAAAGGPLAEIHGRAPVVLPESAHAAWLDRNLTDPEKVGAIAAARVPPEAFTHWKVRLLVNDTNRDGPELIEPADVSVREN
jgi:putative SOS response-associated peptidase YedK